MSSVFENEFRASATKLTVDLCHRALIRASLKGYEKNRDEKRARFQSWELARQAAAETVFELLQRTYNGDYPSLITFITGPSRTGDIERILVLGAHGPRFLTIFLLPNET